MKNQLIHSVILILFIQLSPIGLPQAISCEDNLYISMDSPDGPFCDGDIVVIEIGGFWLGGGISSDVNEYLSYSGDIDIISESSNYPWEVLEIRLDSKRENKLKIRYNFEIEENMFEEYQYCSISKTFTFDVIPSSSGDEVTIKWRQGDILEAQTNLENVCFQWGEIIDYVEMDIEGATASTFAPNTSSESIFINTIKDKKPVPKSEFEYIYYVRISDCDAADSPCNGAIYFTSENFEYVPFYSNPGTLQIEYNIYPNPGNGIINVSSSGYQQNSTPFPTLVTDIHGNPLPTSDLIHAWDQTYIDISAVATGVYFIYFKTGDKTFESFKYIKL